jgi:3-hydroxybutyryl-CoA dehydratase
MEIVKTINISKELVESFALITGDLNPIHLDENYAKGTKFGRTIAHGMLLSSFFSKIIAMDFPGEGSIYLSQTLKFLKPCYVGDSIKIHVSLLNKVQKNKSFIYTLSTKIYDKNNGLLVDGTADVLFDK